MSVALPFVNYISHIVKTCIRRNVKPYPITMHKVVLMSSADKMWCHQLCLKNMDTKAEQFRFYVFTRLKLGDDRIKIHVDLTDIWSQLRFVQYHLQMDWGIQRWKGQLCRWSPSGSSSFSQERANCAFCEEDLIEEDPHINIHEKSDVSMGAAEWIVRNDLNLRKIAARWIR